ncbi:MAG: hypothetical protein HY827_01440 [Actinobacteria bacterium]|nr:hypothetical protein [Actinomycetota bacterium]
MSAVPSVATLLRGAGSDAGFDPNVEIGVIEWGSLALRAGRVGPNLPHMGIFLRFPDRISREEIVAEIDRIAEIPYGVGRKILPPRFRGGRHRWKAVVERPPYEISPESVADGEALTRWMNSHLGVRLDPEFDAGWAAFSTYIDDGGTALLIVLHHLFGIAGGVLGALYGDEDTDPTVNTTGLRFVPENHFSRADETRALRDRFALGTVGLLKLLASLPQLVLGRLRKQAPDPSAPKPIKGPRRLDPTRGELSADRECALAFVPADEWDGRARELGGSGNTLLAAVDANLLRRARIARGGDARRPIQILVPVDLSDRDDLDRLGLRSSAPSGDNAMTTAAVVVEGGAPRHGELRDLRARMKAAYEADADDTPVIRGAGDAMRLVPEAITYRAAERAAKSFDGCASNVGQLPEGMLRLGDHHATHALMLGFPIGNETIAVLHRYEDMVAISVNTDPARMGIGAPTMREWLIEELTEWGFEDVVM